MLNKIRVRIFPRLVNVDIAFQCDIGVHYKPLIESDRRNQDDEFPLPLPYDWHMCCEPLYEQSYDTLTFRCSDTPTNKISGTVFILNDFNDAYESELKITDNYGNEISAGSTVNYGDKDTITLYIQTNRPGEIIAYTDNNNTSVKIFNNNILILSTSDPSKEDRITVKQRSCGEWESDVFIFYTRI